MSIVNIEVQRQYLKSPACVQGLTRPQDVIIMAQKQSLHLCIDGWILIIPISMPSVQLWRCMEWLLRPWGDHDILG